VTVAVREYRPLAKVPILMLHLPSVPILTILIETPSTKSLAVPPGSPVPKTVTTIAVVTPSVLEKPVSGVIQSMVGQGMGKGIGIFVLAAKLPWALAVNSARVSLGSNDRLMRRGSLGCRMVLSLKTKLPRRSVVVWPYETGAAR